MISIKNLVIICALIVCVIMPVLYSILVTVLYLTAKKKVLHLEEQMELFEKKLREHNESLKSSYESHSESKKASSKQKAGFTSENLNR